MKDLRYFSIIVSLKNAGIYSIRILYLTCQLFEILTYVYHIITILKIYIRYALILPLKCSFIKEFYIISTLSPFVRSLDSFTALLAVLFYSYIFFSTCNTPDWIYSSRRFLWSSYFYFTSFHHMHISFFLFFLYYNDTDLNERYVKILYDLNFDKKIYESENYQWPENN